MDVYDEILKICKRDYEDYYEMNSSYSIFYHLISILGRTETNSWVRGCYESSHNMGEFLYIIHKSLRQGDIYSVDIVKDGNTINGHLDMIVYSLINVSRTPNEIFSKIYNLLDGEKV